MKVFACLLASVCVFAACLGGWWFYWPIWQVESRVKSMLPERAAAHLSGVVYNPKTGTACGYVDERDTRGATAGKTHFILRDGNLRLDPKDPIQGSTLQRLESLRRHAEYLALAYASCTKS